MIGFLDRVIFRGGYFAVESWVFAERGKIEKAGGSVAFSIFPRPARLAEPTPIDSNLPRPASSPSPLRQICRAVGIAPP